MSGIVVSRLGVRFGSRLVLGAVDAAFPAGMVTGILGPNGAGKTTLLRAVLGLVPHDGAVTMDGRDIAAMDRMARARAMAYLPQGAGAHWPLEARHVVALGRLPHRGAFARETQADAAAVERAMARADAAQFAGRGVDTLSAGERARVLLARALAVEAPVLLADEPAASLDPAHQLKLMDLLRAEAARGAAVAVTMHDLALASRCCDRILLLWDGRVAAAGAPDTALSDENMAHVFGVRALRVNGAVAAWAAL